MSRSTSVSLWLGKFTNQAAFVNYITPVYDDDGDATSEFREDYFYFDEDYADYAFFPDGVRDLADKLVHFSYGEQYAERAAAYAVASGLHLTHYNAVLLIFQDNYNSLPEHVESKRADAPLQWVGNFPVTT